MLNRWGKIVPRADILAFGTREAVFAGKGPWAFIIPGRVDRNEPTRNIVLPIPNATVGEMLGLFGKFKLDAKDLVALSGGHTVGKTRACDFVTDALEQKCRNEEQLALDDTPDVFHNHYFVALAKKPKSEGVFPSDIGLMNNDDTRKLVLGDVSKFFKQWQSSMHKLSEIGRPKSQQVDNTRPDEGLAASA